MQVENEQQFRAALTNASVVDIRVTATFAVSTRVWAGPPIIIARDINVTGHSLNSSDISSSAWPAIWFNDVKSANAVRELATSHQPKDTCLYLLAPWHG